MGFLLFHHACTVDISITCLVFIMFWVFTFPPFEYFQYLSPLCLWYFFTMWIFPLHVFIICLWFFSTMLIFSFHVFTICLGYLLFQHVAIFITCLYYVYGTYFSTMWMFSSSLPRTTLCRSSLKAAMIPFILSNIMAIFSPLQEAWYWKTSLRGTTC